jgi:uncharacterized protein YjiS (DUF1127 family)
MNRTKPELARSRIAGAAQSPSAAVFAYIAEVFLILETWRRRHQTSMQFARVEARVLRDIGISDSKRFTEVNKPFWEK